MFRVSIKHSGTHQGVFNDALVRIAGRVEKGLEAAATVLAEESGIRCPRDTGYLRETLQVTQRGGGMVARWTVGYGSDKFERERRKSPKEGRMVDRYPHEYARIVHAVRFVGGQVGGGRRHGFGRIMGGTGFLSMPALYKTPEMVLAFNAAAGVT